jgi:HEAT repeat protein
VVTGVLDEFPDHAIDVPVPENTSRHGVPNACNTCHAKQPPEDMAKAMAAWWPDAAARTARRRRLADAFDEVTKQESRPALAAVIADADEAPLLRGTAALLFGQRFPQQAAPELTPLLAAASALVRANAAAALGGAKAKDAADALARLKDDPSLFVRQAAAIALAEMADPRAEAALRALTGKKPSASLPIPHRLLALTLLRRGDLEAAITEFERELDLVPYTPDTLVMLADLYAKTNRMELTRARIEEALSFDPQHPGARKRLAMLNGEGAAPPR